MSEILIKGGILITLDKERRIIKNGAVAIKENKIVSVGKTDELLKNFSKADEVIDAKGKIIMPGLIDTHIHHIQMLARGLADDVDFSYLDPR